MDAPANVAELLTERQLKITRLSIAKGDHRGYTQAEIAKQLGICRDTVAVEKSAIASAVKAAQDGGYIEELLAVIFP